MITLHAEENAVRMLLTPLNSTNPQMWGMEVTPTGINQTKLATPAEFDFFSAWCSKDPINAKKYYDQKTGNS